MGSQALSLLQVEMIKLINRSSGGTVGKKAEFFFCLFPPFFCHGPAWGSCSRAPSVAPRPHHEEEGWSRRGILQASYPPNWGAKAPPPGAEAGGVGEFARAPGHFSKTPP